MELQGIHHVSALTADAARNVGFYTGTLGMRLVKKTVNQDDVSSYHLFYADEVGSPGTDLTFFDIPRMGGGRAGSSSISTVGLRVADADALGRWEERLDELGVAHDAVAPRAGRPTLALRDFEGQHLALVADGSEAANAAATPWSAGPVPAAWAVRGLGPVELTVRDIGPTARVLAELLGMREEGSYRLGSGPQAERVVFAMGPGGPGAELHLRAADLPREQLGRGSVHHVAFRVPDPLQHAAWLERLEAAGIATSGLVERYYFRSIYFREPSGILFELATDGPGFLVDEDREHLGERLSLPPFLEPQRARIEAGLHPLDTASVNGGGHR